MYPHHSRRAIFVRAPRRRPGRRLFIIGVAIGVGFTLGIWPPLPILDQSITPATASEQPVLETPAPLPWYAVHETPSPRAMPPRRPERAHRRAAALAGPLTAGRADPSRETK